MCVCVLLSVSSPSWVLRIWGYEDVTSVHLHLLLPYLSLCILFFVFHKSFILVFNFSLCLTVNPEQPNISFNICCYWEFLICCRYSFWTAEKLNFLHFRRLFLGCNLSKGSMNCHFYSILRSNPFYEPKTSSPVRPQVGAPSLDVGSSQKRRAPPPPSSSPGFGLSPSASKPSSVPDREQALAVGPSPVTAVIGRELASSSPKVTSLHLCNIIKKGSQCPLQIKLDRLCSVTLFN